MLQIQTDTDTILAILAVVHFPSVGFVIHAMQYFVFNFRVFSFCLASQHDFTRPNKLLHPLLYFAFHKRFYKRLYNTEKNESIIAHKKVVNKNHDKRPYLALFYAVVHMLLVI